MTELIGALQRAERAYEETHITRTCGHGLIPKACPECSAIAMARDSAETACPAPVPKDCQARAESIAKEQPLEPKD